MMFVGQALYPGPDHTPADVLVATLRTPNTLAHRPAVDSRPACAAGADPTTRWHHATTAEAALWLALPCREPCCYPRGWLDERSPW